MFMRNQGLQEMDVLRLRLRFRIKTRIFLYMNCINNLLRQKSSKKDFIYFNNIPSPLEVYNESVLVLGRFLCILSRFLDSALS